MSESTILNVFSNLNDSCDSIKELCVTSVLFSPSNAMHLSELVLVVQQKPAFLAVTLPDSVTLGMALLGSSLRGSA